MTIINSWKKKFFVLWAGQGISIFTSSVIQMAIVWYLTDKTGSAAILTAATFLGYMPRVLLGPVAGVLIDRYNRKYIMIISDLFIASITMILFIWGSVAEIPVWVIMAVLVLRAVGTAFHNPSLQAVTPSFVPKEELTTYAGYSQGVESISMLLSPAAAGVLYSFLSLNQIILFDIGGAVFAVATLLFIAVPKIENEGKEKSNVLQETKEGIQVIRKEPGLEGLIVISTLYAIIYFPIGTLFPLICMGYFNGSYVDSGIVETAFSIGMLIGAFLLSAVGKRIKWMNAITLSIGVYGGGLIIGGALPPTGIKIFMVLSFFMGLSIPFYRGVKTAVIQSKIKEEYLGRVFSLVNSIQTIATPIGLGLAGAFAEIIGVNKWFFLSGVLSVVLALVGRLMPSAKKL